MLSNFNSMDFSVWGILQKIACKKKHHSVQSLKCDLLKEWENYENK